MLRLSEASPLLRNHPQKIRGDKPVAQLLLQAAPDPLAEAGGQQRRAEQVFGLGEIACAEACQYVACPPHSHALASAGNGLHRIAGDDTVCFSLEQQDIMAE